MPQVLTVDPGGRGYPSIRAALNAASPGATVTVAPGTYRERLDLHRPVRLEARNRGTVHLVSPGTCAIWANAEGCTVSGLTVSAQDPNYAAVLVDGGALTVVDCDITSQADGVLVRAGSTHVRGCAIRSAGSNGIGVVNARLTAERCTIGPTGRSGIAVNGGRASVDGCDIAGTGGNGLYLLNGATGEYANCVITRTTLPAVALESGADPVVRNAHIHHVPAEAVLVRDAPGRFLECRVESTTGTRAVLIEQGATPRFEHLRLSDISKIGVSVLTGSAPVMHHVSVESVGTQALG